MHMYMNYYNIVYIYIFVQVLLLYYNCYSNCHYTIQLCSYYHEYLDEFYQCNLY